MNIFVSEICSSINSTLMNHIKVKKPSNKKKYSKNIGVIYDVHMFQISFGARAIFLRG